MAHKIKAWSRHEILTHLEEGRQTITIAGEPNPLRLIGVGFHGAITKDPAGRIEEFPLRLVVNIHG